MNKVKYLAQKRVGHIDKFTVFGNLSNPDQSSQTQQLLKKGYRIVWRDGKKLAIKGSEEIECK